MFKNNVNLTPFTRLSTLSIKEEITMKTKMLIRATLTVSVAVGVLVLALMPRTALASALICNGNGGCINYSGSCSSLGAMPSGYTCFFMARIASAPVPGQTVVSISKDSETALMKFGKGGNNQAREGFEEAFDAAFRTGKVISGSEAKTGPKPPITTTNPPIPAQSNNNRIPVCGPNEKPPCNDFGKPRF